MIATINPVLRGWVQYFAVGQRESVLLLRPELGGAEGAAAPDAGTESSGPRVEEVASAVAL